MKKRPNELVLLMGLPASGKTTLARDYVKKGYKRFNKDDMRSMLNSSVFSKSNERYIIECIDEMVIKALKSGDSVVIDDTNINVDHYKRLKKICDELGVDLRINCTPLLVSKYICVKRDALRDNPVGISVIEKIDSKLKHSIEYIGSYISNSNDNNKTAYIFDIDGTLAECGERDIYDGSMVHLDKLIKPVYDILMKLSDENYIIICTGRSSIFKDETIKWLNSNNVKYDMLYMRDKEDKSDDMLVKASMYRDIYSKGINVLGVFDDRDKVVDIWRGFGLQCHQVNYGNF